jgi:hypothetical protein
MLSDGIADMRRAVNVLTKKADRPVQLGIPLALILSEQRSQRA